MVPYTDVETNVILYGTVVLHKDQEGNLEVTPIDEYRREEEKKDGR